MRSLKTIASLAVVLLAGCTTYRESSAEANQDQIRTHLKEQLHCTALELWEAGPNRYTGAGRNDKGTLTLRVTRAGEEIVFDGIYTGDQGGSFHGTMAWLHSSTKGGGHVKVESRSRTTIESN